MTFSQPAGAGDNFTPADYYNPQTGFGNLLLIFPKSYNAEAPTKKGTTQAADADVIVVDRPGPDGQPLVFRDARLFGNLARSVRVLHEQDGSPKKYLGRLGQGPNTQGTPPWIIQNWTEQDVAMATPVAAAFEAGQFAAAVPNPMAAPAAAQSWNPAAQGGAPAGMQSAPYGAPVSAPPQQQWAPAAGPSPATTQPPAQAAPQQWQQPAAPAAQWNAQPAPTTTAPPAPPAAAPASAPAMGAPAASGPPYDPALVARLQAFGITPPPDEATARAIVASLPQG